MLTTHGTLTSLGHIWKCITCGELRVLIQPIRSDKLVTFNCKKCGGIMINAPLDEALEYENKTIELLTKKKRYKQ